MRNRLALVGLVSTFLIAACATQSPATARHDQFPMARGPDPVKTIAIVPGGGDDLAKAIGSELARRGFEISTAASTAGIATGADLKAVSEMYIPGRVGPADMDRLMNRFHDRGIDAVLVLKADGFAPRRWRQYAYWQTADAHLYATNPEPRARTHWYWGWVNIDNTHAKSPSEAAAEIVTRMASFVSNPL